MPGAAACHSTSVAPQCRGSPLLGKTLQRVETASLTCVLPSMLGEGMTRPAGKATEVTEERLLACCNNKQMRDCGGHRSLKHIYQGFQGY